VPQPNTPYDIRIENVLVGSDVVEEKTTPPPPIQPNLIPRRKEKQEAKYYVK
jgi:hypothetical protein